MTSKIALLFAALALGLVFLRGPQGATTAPKETAYERVMRTRALRCGYIPYAYFFRLDPNTKAKSGVMVDIMNEIGRLTDIKIEWTAELTWATVSTDIDSGRVDALCSGMWIDTRLGRVLAYSSPLFFNSIGAYGRADETRFAKLESLNNPNVRSVARDGNTTAIVTQQDFPRATPVSMPASASDGEMIEYVLTKKADVIFYGDDYLMDFIAKNPGRLKPLFPGQKLRLYATAIGLPMQDVALKNLFDNSIMELQGSKFIAKTLQTYVPQGGWSEGFSVTP